MIYSTFIYVPETDPPVGRTREPLSLLGSFFKLNGEGAANPVQGVGGAKVPFSAVPFLQPIKLFRSPWVLFLTVFDGGRRLDPYCSSPTYPSRTDPYPDGVSLPAFYWRLVPAVLVKLSSTVWTVQCLGNVLLQAFARLSVNDSTEKP
jgi:hypothetical protein